MPNAAAVDSARPEPMVRNSPVGAASALIGAEVSPIPGLTGSGEGTLGYSAPLGSGPWDLSAPMPTRSTLS